MSVVPKQGYDVVAGSRILAARRLGVDRVVVLSPQQVVTRERAIEALQRIADGALSNPPEAIRDVARAALGELV